MFIVKWEKIASSGHFGYTVGMSTSEGNRPQQPPRRFRNADALEVKPQFILGVPLETLAEEIAQKRGTPVDQALRFLERVRARDGWVRERELHLEGVNRLAQQKAASDRIGSLTATQGAIADRLMQLGLDELVTTKALNRYDALRTLETGFRFAYRAIGQPSDVRTVDDIPRPPDAREQAARAEHYQNMSRDELLAEVSRLSKEEE